MTEVSTDITTQSAASPQIELNFRSDFELGRVLPHNLKPLETISKNFYWCWQPEGVALFRDLDPGLWDVCEQSPRRLLEEVSELRLWQRSVDTEYIGRLESFARRFDDYMQADRPAADDSQSIAYFCAEYGVHNSLPNYSGGLGILAGDHLKSASDLNLPLTAVGLLYRYGYFRQRIRHDGWQEEGYNDVFGSQLAVTPLLDENGGRITVTIHIRDRRVITQAWVANVGRVSLYLLDTNVYTNDPVDRLITGHLYGGDTETRVVQEKVLGIGGVRLLRRLGISPSTYHLNEGHSAFLTLELVREYLSEHTDNSFEAAAAVTRKKCVFTTHTPVAAGNDIFSQQVMNNCFTGDFIASLRLTNDEFLALGRTNPADASEAFGMSPLAIRMCRSSNGVSKKHGEVSRALWQKMFPDIASSDGVPITSVTNGVHVPTWVAPAFQRLFERHLGPDWCAATRDAARWSALVEDLPDREVWETHRELKNLLIAFIRERTRSKETGNRNTINERADTRNLFSPDVLTIGFARRVAAYKRWDLIFSDLQRLLKMVDDTERPVQFVFAGKAHPQDPTAKTILQELMSINHTSNWQNRAVFIQDYDQEVARYLVHGVDVWMNVPRRPMEASGTSGMKAAMNGALNFSILDGWWIEGYNGQNGYVIGELAADRPDAEMDHADAQSLYATLENEIIPAYYAGGDAGLPAEWVRKMKNSIATLTPLFSSDRMVTDYLKNIYE